jgi:hypothetical protein
MMSVCLDLEIGASVATLLNLRYRGIAEPYSWTYSPYSRVEIGGDGRSRGFGYGTASWSWDNLPQDQLDKFLDFFDAVTDSSVAIVIRTYQDTGVGRSNMVETFDAIMHRPLDDQSKTQINESVLPVYSDVTISFTRLEITS